MADIVPAAVRRRPFILAAEPKGDKLRQWQSAIFETFGAIDMHIREDLNFSGAIRRVSFPGLELTEVRSSSECAHRTRRHLTGDQHDAVALLLIRRGSVEIDQYNKRNIIGAGAFTLLDLNEPYGWTHACPAHVIGIKLPRAALTERVGNLTPYVGSMRGACVGVGRLTADFLESFASQADSIDESAAAGLVRQFLELTELLLIAQKSEKSLPATTPVEAIYRRALAFIDRHLSDPDLVPGDIAQAMPVSLRYLHAIFRMFGSTVCETVQSRRLAFCHSSLFAAPQLRISQVAYRAGFRTHAHFSTAFKGKYGYSPREVRSRCLSATQNENR